MIFSFYAPSEEWRRDNKTKFFVMKNPGMKRCRMRNIFCWIKSFYLDEEEEDEEDTEILTDEQVVERIKHIIHKRMLLARRQIRLEKRLESLELLRDCDQNYLLSLPSGQANGEVNGLLQKRRREGDTLTPPNRKHLKTEMPWGNETNQIALSRHGMFVIRHLRFISYYGLNIDFKTSYTTVWIYKSHVKLLDKSCNDYVT